jgi:hypothetical protein
MAMLDRTLILNALEGAFRKLEVSVPPPVRKTWGDSFVFRYERQSIQEAIVQKLARLMSGLHAVEVLLERGLFQEQGMMQRAVDEIEEDISFLALGVIKNEITSLHTDYLKYFYAEEFNDPNDIVGSHSSRGMVKREKIRGYVNRAITSVGAKPNDAAKVLTKAYSGFVHAASPHIMDMYGGWPPRFDINGASKDFRYQAQVLDAENVFFRAIIGTALAAKALGNEEQFSAMCALQTKIYEKMYCV